jgi:ankyrin repeat protein
MLDEYPDCAQAKDKSGTLPLHNADHSCHDSAIQRFLSIYPEGIYAQDTNGKTPLGWIFAVGKDTDTDALQLQIRMMDAMADVVPDAFLKRTCSICCDNEACNCLKEHLRVSRVRKSPRPACIAFFVPAFSNCVSD